MKLTFTEWQAKVREIHKRIQTEIDAKAVRAEQERMNKVMQPCDELQDKANSAQQKDV